jgi:hypothetical protein
MREQEKLAAARRQEKAKKTHFCAVLLCELSNKLGVLHSQPISSRSHPIQSVPVLSVGHCVNPT